jgi:V/A-type H+-transporting ATPase subunit I
LFGFLFGSFFGREDVIPALWFRPFENIMSFLRMSVVFGVGVLSLGLLLNVIQGFRRKSWREAVFGKNGLAGVALYWTVIIVAIYLLKGGILTLSAKCAIGIILGGSVLLVAFGNHLYLRLKKRRSEEGLLESAFGVVELALSILANTLSFIRVAAFNISHAGLCLAIYAVADQLGQLMPGKATSLSVIIPGHLLIIGLEGLIVLIQCLRLEYYEFFSKFFSGQGVKFEPLRIS